MVAIAYRRRSLQRFEFKQGSRDRAASKIRTKVQFPLQLNMLPYTTRGQSEGGKDSHELSRSCVYDLLSVVEHVGEIDTGHYVSYCRVGDQVRCFDSLSGAPRVCTNDACYTKWFSFNDHRVELAKKSDVLGSQAYLLFYIIRTLT